MRFLILSVLKAVQNPWKCGKIKGKLYLEDIPCLNLEKKSHQEVLDNIPNHIGIIMDGNGRWAKKRLQPRVMGHKAGMDALQKVTIEASHLELRY